MKAQSLEQLIGSIGQGQHSPIMPDNTDQALPEDFFDKQDEEDTFDEQAEDLDFQKNLAEDMDNGYLDRLASELLQLVEDDIQTRKPWMNKITEVKEQIGLGEDSSFEEPFPGSSSVVYPMITEAQIQFQARALPEIFPNDPVNSVVLGDSTPDLEDQAERVKDVLNYQVQYQDKGNKKDFRKMLWWLPLTGSAFRYVFHDTLRNMNKVRFVPVEDFIVPYATTSLEDAPHFTHRIRDNKNDLLKLMKMGFYRTVPLFDQSNDDNEESNNAVQEMRDDSDGFTKNDDGSSILPHSQYLVYINYDLQGHEDIDEETGEETGIGLPYVITIHADSKQILAIRRNWKPDDELRDTRIFYTHYQYQEGPGFYGSGLPHLIGSLQKAATGALRSFGDALAFSIMQSGFKSKEAKIVGDQVLSPGSFPDIDMMGADDINKVVKVLNFLPPTPQVLQYIEMLNEKAQQIVSTTDLMTGDSSPQNSPVGSTLAMIEQAQKVISAQHKSLFESFSDEIQKLADLNYDFLPDEDTFKVPGKMGIIRRSDFDGQIDVIPTADPSVASFQQRQAIDQATMQMFSIPEFKQYAKDAGYPLLRRMLKNLNVPSLDEVLVTPEEAAQQLQQAQQNPPPNPDIIKAQVMQQDSQTKSQTAQAYAQLDAAKHEMDKEKLDLDEKQLLMDGILRDKEIDLKYGAINQQVSQGADQLALQGISTALQHGVAMSAQQQAVASQQADQQHQMAMQRSQAVGQAASQQQQPQDAEAQPQAPNPQDVHDQMMQAQQSGQPQVPPQADRAKQNMLMRLINKVRGR